jgi:UDP-glucuronate 4-epimerase
VAILITGCAGFIGSSLAFKLSKLGHDVIGIDSFYDSNNSRLPRLRAAKLKRDCGIEVMQADVLDLQKLQSVNLGIKQIIHLAAFPGVRNSIGREDIYWQNNVHGFRNILRLAEIQKVENLLYASSSSVYGDKAILGPVKEEFANGFGLKSFYAKTKWQNELDARKFSLTTGIPTLALRFFTVYGEWGRPDMAYWIFLRKIVRGEAIQIFGQNGGIRNMSYIEDVVNAIAGLLVPLMSVEALNVASNNQTSGLEIVNKLSQISNMKVKQIEFSDRQNEDVEITTADLHKLFELVEHSDTSIDIGLTNFVKWYFENLDELNSIGLL